MALMLKNARLIDPQIGLDEVADILIRDGKIVEVGHDLAMEKGVERDLAGKIVTPGLVDMHVHFRDPARSRRRTSPLVPVRRPTVVSPRCAPCRTRARWSTTPWPWNM